MLNSPKPCDEPVPPSDCALYAHLISLISACRSCPVVISMPVMHLGFVRCRMSDIRWEAQSIFAPQARPCSVRIFPSTRPRLFCIREDPSPTLSAPSRFHPLRGHRTSDIGHRTSDLRHLSFPSDIGHLTSDLCPFLLCASAPLREILINLWTQAWYMRHNRGQEFIRSNDGNFSEGVED
jgi:hypothetical protein